MSPFCNYFGAFFITYCLSGKTNLKPTPKAIGVSKHTKFDLEYQWQFVNFTWPSPQTYKNALNFRYYIPENVGMTGIKYYKEAIYVAMPRMRRGVPATLGKLPLRNAPKFNPPLQPYPSWDKNIYHKDCTNIQSVQSMEIDKNGIMWVLDGLRTNNITRCPPKLLLLDLNNKGSEILSYIFPKDICSFQGGFLNDIVIDDTDDGFAYITDNSLVDPGLIVYSRRQNRAWKLRDRTMFDEKDASNFVVGNFTFKRLAPLDGIALSPPLTKTGNKILFYSPLAGMHLYSINTKILKNEDLISSGEWRRTIKVVGKKQGQSDGLMMDNTGDLFYTLPPLYGVGKWNMNTPFSSAEVIMEDKKKMIWPDSFAFDDKGNLRLLTSSVNKFMDVSVNLQLGSEVILRIFKLYTGTKSYLN